MDGGPSRQGWLRAHLVGGQQAVQELGGGAVQGLDEVHGTVQAGACCAMWRAVLW